MARHQARRTHAGEVPGLTVVIFQVAGLFLYPSLPLASGDRIVQLSLQDVAANEPEGKALYDFLSWRDSLRSIDKVGAWRDSSRNLIVADGPL